MSFEDTIQIHVNTILAAQEVAGEYPQSSSMLSRTPQV